SAPSYVDPPAVTVGSQNTAFTSNATLAPGNYGNITLSGGATLTLSPGTYNINSVALSGQSILTFSPAGQVVVNVAGNNVAKPIDFSGGTLVNPSRVPRNVQFVYGGNRPITLSG